MKIDSQKKQGFGVKNIYINQMMKPKKSNNLNYVFFENAKNISDYSMNQSINFHPKKIFFNKKTIKKLYQNNYPNQSFSIKGNSNYAPQKKIHFKSTNKYNSKVEPIETYTGITISGRKMGQNNYQIKNPFKERSNSENKINSFNRTYTFFNNKDNNKDNHKDNNNYNNLSYFKGKPTDKSKSKINNSKKKIDKITINLSNISYQYLPTKLYNHNINKENVSKTIKKNNSPVRNRSNSKKYFYQNVNQKKINTEEKTMFQSKIQRKNSNQMSPNINTTSKGGSVTTPNSNNNSKIKNEQRRQKYLSDKRRLKSRQVNRQCKGVISNSTGVNNEKILDFDKFLNGTTPKRKQNGNIYIKNKSIHNSPSMPSINSIIDDNNISINTSKKFHWIKKNKSLKEYNMLFNNLNIRNDQNHYDYSSNSTYSNYNTIKKIKEKELFEQSAITIQSVFRGYLMKCKLDTYLIQYKDYNRGLEILEKTIKSFLDKNINIEEENQKFFNFLKDNEKKNNNCKSCKTFKLLNLPSTPPSTEKNDLNKKFYMNLFLHKEIGERFNIIKENKQKEIEQKYKEEIDNINNKMDKLIEENKSLKDINEKNKLKESKFKELSMENKKKENIINIITNDNQNLARRLKIIQDKFNQLEIHNQTKIFYNSENNQYNNSKELFIEYRNFYLLFLIHKKNAYYFDLLRKYFNKYRNIINSLRENEKDINILKKQKLKLLVYDKKNKEYIFLKNNFAKFYYKSLLYYREMQNREDILRAKLINIVLKKDKINKAIIKSYFKKFYYKGIIINLIEEKKKNFSEKKQEKFNKMNKLIKSIEQRKDKHNYLIIRDCFDKWNLFSKILSMKAVTDEKKRKKRQKQRMKKKNEKSLNKYMANGNNILHIGKSNSVNIINKENLICLEHSVTTDLSGGDANDKIDKILKASEKLGDIFYRAAINHKLLEKNHNLNKNKEINAKENSDKKEKNIDNNENDNDYEEDSGDSFGI